MALAEDLALLIRQEQLLQFEHFDEAVAWQLGARLHARAEAQGWALLIEVRRFDQVLFLAGRPGITPHNHDWIRRKRNTVARFLCSSYRIGHQLALDQKDITQRYNLPLCDYASAGGSFPITVKGAGVIGCVTVSGLPEREDHQVIVDALCDLLGQDRAALSLAAPAKRASEKAAREPVSG